LGSGTAGEADSRLEEDARQHGRERWFRGYQLDELFCELDDLQRCVQGIVREYFTAVPVARAEQIAAHQAVENLFSATIYEAIRQLLAQQEQRIAESLRARDRALASQQKSDERLRMAAEAARLGIFEWGLHGAASVWENERMYEITGQPHASGPLSRHAFVDELIHRDDKDRFLERYDAARSDGIEFHHAFRIRRIDDHVVRVVDMHGQFRTGMSETGRMSRSGTNGESERTNDGNERGTDASFVGTLEDITRRVADEDSLRESNRRKDAFLATLAHELRNPLAPIKNAAQILKLSAKDGPSELRWVQAVIERQCDHLTALVDDLLDISRITTGKVRLKRKAVELKDVISRAVEINMPEAAAHAAPINIALPDGRICIDGDMTRLVQIVSNLLDNAIKYSDDGSAVSVHCEVHDRHARIVVRDAGRGIDAAQLEKIFEPYIPVAPSDGPFRSSLGIGLAVVKELVDLHGGTVSARSDGLGKGAEFVVTLPLA
jgi:signal transduction histidine kinase